MAEKTFRLQLTPKVAERLWHCNITLQDIIFPLFQDSVGSRASQVVISTSTIDGKTWLAVSDDGKEIFENNLTNFEKNKNAYFVGLSRQLSICNLLHRGATIESKKLSVTLAPEDFPVNRDEMMRSSNIERGTKISFPIDASEITQLLRVVKCIAVYSPIPVVFNGSKFSQTNRVLAQV